jgi:hypothetical protein
VVGGPYLPEDHVLDKLRPRSVYDVLAAIGCFAALTTGVAYAADTIGSDDVINDSLLSEDIKNGTLRGGDLTPGTIGSSRVADGTLVSPDVQDETLTGADLKNGTIGASDIAANSLGGGRIADNSLKGADIDEGSLTGVVRGFTRRTGYSPGAEEFSSSASPQTAVATCPDETKLIGTAFDIRGETTSGEYPDATSAITVESVYASLAGDSVEVTAYETQPISANWYVAATALCAHVE